ncbi:MAG: hypothetical protein WAV38_10840 [Xanthobacteraceae bacterium]
MYPADPTIGAAAQPGVAPVWFAFSTTAVPFTMTVVRAPLGYLWGSA